MLKKFLTILTFIFGLSLSAQPTLAYNPEDFSISLYPTSQTVELIPGEQRTGSVSIVNTGKAPFSFSVSASPYQATGEGYDADFSTVNTYTSLATWITFDQDSYSAEPGETIEAKFTIDVPADAVGGGQYAAIMAYTEDSADSNASIAVASQIAAILYGRVNGPEMHPEGEIVDQHIPGFLLGGPLEISETAYNTGNVDFTVYHAVTITDFFTGEEIINPETTDSEKRIIGSDNSVVLPGTSRSNTIVWENTPKIGVVRVQQKILILDEELNSEQIVIFCPLWLILSVAGLVALLALWIALIVRRHRRKQPQVF